MSEEIKNNIQEDEIDLRDLLLTLWKGKWIIFGVTIVVAVVAFFYVKSLPDQYTVVTKAVIPSTGGRSKMSGLAVLAGVSLSSSGGEIDLMQHVEIVVKNSYFMDKLIEKKWFVNGDSVLLEGFLEIEKDTTVKNWKYVHKMKLYGVLRSPKAKYVTVVNDDGVLELTSKFTSPELAYQINLYLRDLLVDYFENTYRTKDSENVKFIKARLDEIEAKLNRSEKALADFKKKNIMTSSPLVLLEEKRLGREIQKNLEIYTESSKQYELARIEEKKQQPVLEVIQEPELPIGPSGPNRKLMIVVGLVLGGVFGVFVVFAIEWGRKLYSKGVETKE